MKGAWYRVRLESLPESYLSALEFGDYGDGTGATTMTGSPSRLTAVDKCGHDRYDDDGGSDPGNQTTRMVSPYSEQTSVTSASEFLPR